MNKKKILSYYKNLEIDKLSRWSICFITIGLISGLGAILFTFMCDIGICFFMNFIAGYYPSSPAGESHIVLSTSTILNKYILLFLPSIGGLLSGWLVYKFAPEAEGHGTDAAIGAYHKFGGKIRPRVPFIKTIASSITLTTGGSGGREGPIAQIGAGFGSFLGEKFKLSKKERRVMMAAGVSAGVGSIFRAPLAGAIFAAEVLYKDPDLEPEVLIPAGISSVVAYCTFCLIFGWGSLFESPFFKFKNTVEIISYLILALVLTCVSYYYVNFFYSSIFFFKSIKKTPNYIKPAIGGLFTGIIGFFVQDSLSFGYGFVQKAIYNEVTISALFILAVAKILTTSFSIGSGGSGGVFGPSVVIGGSIGGLVGKILNYINPILVSEPGAFVVVGMAGFFTAVSNTPISTIIFVSEMTNSYHLLLPSLLVCSVTYTLSKRWTIFHQQVKSRLNSPAHKKDFFIDVLESYQVAKLMLEIKKANLISCNMCLKDFKKYFTNTNQNYFPVINKYNIITKIFSINDIRPLLFEHKIESIINVNNIGIKKIITTTSKESINNVFKKFTTRNIDSLPVISKKDSGIILGMINRREVIDFYNKEIKDLRKKNYKFI